MQEMLRRRPVLRAAAIVGGAYWAGKRRMETRRRELEAAAESGAGLAGAQPGARPRIPTLPSS